MFPSRMISDTRIRVSICKFTAGKHAVRADWLGSAWDSTEAGPVGLDGFLSRQSQRNHGPYRHFGISRQTFYRWHSAAMIGLT